jgi:hypothetical protein
MTTDEQKIADLKTAWRIRQAESRLQQAEKLLKEMAEAMEWNDGLNEMDFVMRKIKDVAAMRLKWETALESYRQFVKEGEK